ncbi:RHS repeat domain-containing protein [Tenacibaculum maritimum]|uniref:RHS repeat domain-containing protein n=1 Tax=Tenacibaculum maritimum TaxID=107401 RepID=UPI0038901995
MYDEGGEQVWERSLDLNEKVINGSNAPCPFLYQGQYYDKEIELAYNRFRYYDPDDGRYISKDPIGLLSGEYGFYNYVGDSNGWIDPMGLEKTYLKKNGGSNDVDFITEHSKKHKFDSSRNSTKNRSQFGENIDVKKLREDTMKNPDKIETKLDREGNLYATKYIKDYDFNISTADTPTGKHRVFINHIDPTRSSQFPYVPRN